MLLRQGRSGYLRPRQRPGRRCLWPLNVGLQEIGLAALLCRLPNEYRLRSTNGLLHSNQPYREALRRRLASARHAHETQPTPHGRKTGLLALVLPLLIYWSVVAFPTVFSLVLSLTNYNGGRIFGGQAISFVGLQHYVRMFKDPYFWISLKNNIYIMLVSLFGQIPLGFLFAYVIHRKLVRQRDFFQTMIYLPSVISTIVIAILWQSFFSPYGPFTELVQKFIPNWENELFFDPHKAILPVLFVILWMYTGTYLIIFLANLQKIDPALIEAALMEPLNGKS